LVRIRGTVWVDTTMNKISRESLYTDVAIIADCRFPNEVLAIKKAGGLVVKLSRDLFHSNSSSECALDPENFDQNLFDLIIEDNLGIEDRDSILLGFLILHLKDWKLN